MNKPLRKLALAALLLPMTVMPMISAAQSPRLDLPDLQSLAHNASDTVNISLGPWLLHTAGALIDDKDPNALSAKQLLAGIDSIRVRSFEFSRDAAYSAADIEPVRRQLDGHGWTPLLQSHDRNTGEQVDVYVMMDNDRTKGFALISSEPRQLTIINITGSIDLASLPALERRLHLPAVSAVTEATNPPSAVMPSL